MANILGVIPARYASTRFPGKPLVEIAGKSMIQRVYDQACQSASLHQVMVATDDERIAAHVRDFGGQVHITRPDHPSGTDRCAEVALAMPEYEMVVNIQGDEPFLDPSQIDLLTAPLISGQADISTLAKMIREGDLLFNPNIVKVVFDARGRALYFSRSTIPYLRNTARENWANEPVFYKHIGLYGFRRQTLLEVTALSPSRLEKLESLEQLRWLENGRSIFVGITELETIGIDTPEDLKRAEEWLAGGQ